MDVQVEKPHKEENVEDRLAQQMGWRMQLKGPYVVQEFAIYVRLIGQEQARRDVPG